MGRSFQLPHPPPIHRVITANELGDKFCIIRDYPYDIKMNELKKHYDKWSLNLLRETWKQKQTENTRTLYGSSIVYDRWIKLPNPNDYP